MFAILKIHVNWNGTEKATFAIAISYIAAQEINDIGRTDRSYDIELTIGIRADLLKS